MQGFSILFRPLSVANFRWQGEFTPQVRGPRAYSSSSPLPLPSTIAGAIAAAAVQASLAGDLCPSRCRDGSDPYCETKHILEHVFGEDYTLRGPYYFAELRGCNRELRRIICVYWSETSLLCVEAQDYKAFIARVPRVQSIGIALNSLSKRVLEHYMYTMVSVDHTLLPNVIASKLSEGSGDNCSFKLERHGILVEVYSSSIDSDIPDKLNNTTVTLGGEQRLFRIEILVENGEYYQPARMLIDKVKGEKCVYWHIASPVLLCSYEEHSTTSMSTSKSIADWEPTIPKKLLEHIVTRILGLEECEQLLPEKGRKLVLSAIGLGYSLCGNGHRKYCRAIMPGYGVLGATKDYLPKYVKGFGTHSQLAWGTLFPLSEKLLYTF